MHVQNRRSTRIAHALALGMVWQARVRRHSNAGIPHLDATLWSHGPGLRDRAHRTLSSPLPNAPSPPRFGPRLRADRDLVTRPCED